MQSFMIMLLTCSVTMSALAIFYMAITPLLARRYSEKGRYYAWLIIVIGLIIPFRPQFSNTIVRVDMPSKATAPIIQTGNITAVVIPDVNTVSPPAMPIISWQQAAVVVWLAGMIAFLAYHFIKHYCFLKMAGRWSENITNDQTLTLFQCLKTEMGISKKINLYLCSSVGSPMMIGFLNPRILLPKDDLAQDELQFILKHELIHFKRKDLLYKYLVLAATAIHWFNPIVHLTAKAIAAGCELSCDAEVIQNTDADTRQHYSETIIGVVKYQSKLKTGLSTNFYGGKKGMKKRIFSIMDMGKKRTSAAILCCMLVLTLSTGMAFAANTTKKDLPELRDTTQNAQAVSKVRESIISRLDPGTGKTSYSWDSGKTWTTMTDEEYSAMFPSPDIEWWTYDGYKAWMEQQIADLQAMADDGVPDYYDKNGALCEFTQADVEESAALHQSILDSIGNGQKVSKTVNGSTDTVITSDPNNIMGISESSSSGAVTIYGEALEQTEADNAHSYEKYAPFGLVYRNRELFYNGEAVRCFDDWYSLGGNNQACLSYFNDGGTVDVHSIRDFSKIVYNPDGSVDPSGRLMGVEEYSQAEFEARDMSIYSTEPDPLIAAAVAESVRDAIRPFERFGVSYDEKAGMLKYDGLPVREIYDEVTGLLVTLSAGTGFPYGDIPENVVDLTAVYTNGALTGLRKSTQEEFDARTHQRFYAIAEAISIESLSEGVSQSGIMEFANGKTTAERFEDYAAFGVKFETKSINGGLGNIYYNGQLVNTFIDEMPDGGVFMCGSSDGGNLSVRTVYDEDGKFIGVETMKD